MAENHDWELTEEEEKEITKRSLMIAAIPAVIWLLAVLFYPLFRS